MAHLTRREIQERYGVSPSTFKRWGLRHVGVRPPRNTYLYDEEEVAAHLANPAVLLGSMLSNQVQERRAQIQALGFDPSLFAEPVPYLPVHEFTADSWTKTLDDALQANQLTGRRQVAVLKASMGSGKTYNTRPWMRRFRGSLLAVAPRIAIVSKLASDYGLANYRTCERDAGKIYEPRVASTLDSLWRVEMVPDVVLLDEVEGLRRHMTAETIQPKALEVWKVFLRRMRQAKLIVCMDADVSKYTLEWLHEVTGVDTEMFRGFQDPIDRTVQAHLHYTRRQKYLWLRDLEEVVRGGGRAWVATDSKWMVYRLGCYFKDLDPPPTLISQEHLEWEEAEKQLDKTRLVVASPRVTSSVSIDEEGWHMFALFVGRGQSIPDAFQAMRRVRKPVGGFIRVHIGNEKQSEAHKHNTNEEDVKRQIDTKFRRALQRHGLKPSPSEWNDYGIMIETLGLNALQTNITENDWRQAFLREEQARQTIRVDMIGKDKDYPEYKAAWTDTKFEAREVRKDQLLNAEVQWAKTIRKQIEATFGKVSPEAMEVYLGREHLLGEDAHQDDLQRMRGGPLALNRAWLMCYFLRNVLFNEMPFDEEARDLRAAGPQSRYAVLRVNAMRRCVHHLGFPNGRIIEGAGIRFYKALGRYTLVLPDGSETPWHRSQGGSKVGPPALDSSGTLRHLWHYPVARSGRARQIRDILWVAGYYTEYEKGGEGKDEYWQVTIVGNEHHLVDPDNASSDLVQKINIETGNVDLEPGTETLIRDEPHP